MFLRLPICITQVPERPRNRPSDEEKAMAPPFVFGGAWRGQQADDEVQPGEEAGTSRSSPAAEPTTIAPRRQ